MEVLPTIKQKTFPFQAFHSKRFQKLESIQYSVVLAITGAIRGTSRDSQCRELGFESLESRRWYCKLRCFYKCLQDSIAEVFI